jgi:hypothetical protein
MTDGYTGTVKGIADRRGWCDLWPGPKADGVRATWRRARRSKLRVKMAIKLGTETRIVTIVSCRLLRGGLVRLRFEADPMTVSVTSGTEMP